MVSPDDDWRKYGDALEPIAIIGMACRFPGDVSSPEQFWDMLVHQRSGQGPVPESRYNARAWHHPDHDRRGAVSRFHKYNLPQMMRLIF